MDENSDVIRKYSQKGMRFVLLDQFFEDLQTPGMIFDILAPEMALTMNLVPQLIERKTVKNLL